MRYIANWRECSSVCWYGDINFLGYHSASDTAMRIDDAKMAGELIDIINDA